MIDLSDIKWHEKSRRASSSTGPEAFITPKGRFGFNAAVAEMLSTGGFPEAFLLGYVPSENAIVMKGSEKGEPNSYRITRQGRNLYYFSPTRFLSDNGIEAPSTSYRAEPEVDPEEKVVILRLEKPQTKKKK